MLLHGSKQTKKNPESPNTVRYSPLARCKRTMRETVEVERRRRKGKAGGRKTVLRTGKRAVGIVPRGMCHRQEIPTGCSEISREQLTSRSWHRYKSGARVAATRARRRRPVFVAAYTRVQRADLHSVRYASKRSNAVASRTHAQCQLMSRLLMNLATMTRDHRHRMRIVPIVFQPGPRPATPVPAPIALLLV